MESVRLGQAAELLELSIDTVRRLFDSGRLPGWKTPGGNRRVPLDEVMRLRRELREPSEVLSARG